MNGWSVWFLCKKIGFWNNPYIHCLERQVSYFFKATLPLKPATIALKIGQVGSI